MSAPPDPTGDALLDVGAQAERTALAWQRTGLAAAVVGALLVRAAPQAAPGAAVLGGGLLLAAVGAPLRYRSVLRAVRDGRDASAGWMLATAAGVAVLAVLVSVATLLG